jgi:photosystem II stability/assembly factor-like uncharacterized protein
VPAAVVVAVLIVVALVVSAKSGTSTGSSSVQPTVGGDLHSLIVDPANPNHLFVGGHQAVATSTNAGKTWHQVGSLDNADAMAWGYTSTAMFVSGHPGLNRSDDGGHTFRQVNGGLPDTDVHAFGAGSTTLYGASPNVGVFASIDDGKTWSVRSSEIGRSFMGRILIGPDDQHLLAPDGNVGVAESTDGGRTWVRTGPLPSAMWLSRSGTTVLASGPAGAAQSTDDGKHWSALSLPDGASIVEASSVTATFFAAGLDGTTARIWVSHDGGGHWSTP